jgi:hypothetical protein
MTLVQEQALSLHKVTSEQVTQLDVKAIQTLDKVRQQYYWLHMRINIERVMLTVTSAQQVKDPESRVDASV